MIIISRHWFKSWFLSTSNKLEVLIGLSIINNTLPFNNLNDFFGNKECAPIIVTGTTGNLDRIAKIKPPFLNGSIFPTSERVPSGYINVENWDEIFIDHEIQKY